MNIFFCICFNCFVCVLFVGVFFFGLFLVVDVVSVLVLFIVIYQVQCDGQMIGEVIIILSVIDGGYVYCNQICGMVGLVVLLGVSFDEIMCFCWYDDVFEMLIYDYVMDVVIKQKYCYLQVDWLVGQVIVDDGKGLIYYVSVLGMVDCNILLLVLGLVLCDGCKNVVLLVGVKQCVEQQQYVVQVIELVLVLVGEFKVQWVSCIDIDKLFDVWYVLVKFLLLVKMVQFEGGNFILLLVKFYLL